MRRAVHVRPEQQSSSCSLVVANAPPHRAARSTRPSTASATTGRGDSPCPAHSFSHRQCPPRLPAQDPGHDQPKPRDGVYRGLAGAEHVQVGGRQLQKPGRNVRAKSGPNKSILDQGWFEFRRQLDYKLASNGGWLVAVPPRNTSRTCPCCGRVSADNRQTQAQFVCVECGFESNADVVGAINVLSAEHARFACEAVQQCRQQQEPAEATHSGSKPG